MDVQDRIRKEIQQKVWDQRRKEIFAKKAEGEEELSGWVLPEFPLGETGDFREKYERFERERRAQGRERLRETRNHLDFYRYMEQREIEAGHHLTPGLIREKIRVWEDREKALGEEDPILDLLVKEERWKRERKGIEGKLIATPYVQTAANTIIRRFRKGEGVFLRGHLGTGKTELATACAIAYGKALKRDQRIEEKLKDRPEKGEDLYPFWVQAKEEVEKVMEEFPEDFSPYFISGNRDLRAADLFSEKVLSLQGALGNKTVKEALDEENRLLQGLNEEEKAEGRALYRLKEGSFGTTVQRISREVLLALEEGSPVVIDELNTIGAEHVIGLNDLLQKKPGEEVYITGVGRKKVEPGFALIGTGNLSSPSVLYTGTEDLNPAFASRFYSFEYSYLPQNRKGTLWNQENPEKNELFRGLISLLAEEEGDLYLPGGKRGMEDVFRLCGLARATQEIFSGRYKEDGRNYELNGSVLSFRNLLRVLSTWNRGEISLDQALWQGFIGGITDEEDINTIMELAVMYGFFPEADGWRVPLRGPGEAPITEEEIRPERDFPPSVLPTLILKEEVIPLLFGKLSDFREIPDFLQEFVEEEGVSPEEFSQMERRLESMEEVVMMERLFNEDHE